MFSPTKISGLAPELKREEFYDVESCPRFYGILKDSKGISTVVSCTNFFEHTEHNTMMYHKVYGIHESLPYILDLDKKSQEGKSVRQSLKDILKILSKKSNHISLNDIISEIQDSFNRKK